MTIAKAMKEFLVYELQAQRAKCHQLRESSHHVVIRAHFTMSMQPNND